MDKNNINCIIIFVIIVSLLLYCLYYHKFYLNEKLTDYNKFYLNDNSKQHNVLNETNVLNKKIQEIINSELNNNEKLKELSNRKYLVRKNFDKLNSENSILIKNLLKHVKERYLEKEDKVLKIINEAKSIENQKCDFNNINISKLDLENYLINTRVNLNERKFTNNNITLSLLNKHKINANNSNDNSHNSHNNEKLYYIKNGINYISIKKIRNSDYLQVCEKSILDNTCYFIICNHIFGDCSNESAPKDPKYITPYIERGYVLYTELKNEYNKNLKDNYHVTFNDTNNFYYIFEDKQLVKDNLNKIQFHEKI